MSRTSNGRRSIVIAAWLWAGAAGAATCDKIDYVEVKDWKPEAIERAYCRDSKLFEIEIETDRGLRKGGVWSAGNSRQDEIARCSVQLQLYARVLKNVHGRERPICK